MLAAVVLFILEIFTPTFFFACIGVGCAVAGVGALLLPHFTVLHWMLLTLGCTLSFIYLRPFVRKYFYATRNNVKTNTDSLVGKTGRVVEATDPAAGTCRVKVGGDDWRAQTVDNQQFTKGQSVTVVGLDGTTLMVKSNG
ncbi:hypothetical protein AGMMS4956_03180 [Bacteroidia bacterium]|nr:hypothetical protein AGMMS4956_03180 [Bacteroidia bacterium]